MHRVDSHVPRPALRVGPPPLADSHPHRPRLLVADFPITVRAALAQIVDMRNRNRGQPPVPLIAVLVELTVYNLLRRRPAQRLMRFVHRRQLFDVRWRLSAVRPGPAVDAAPLDPRWLLA